MALPPWDASDFIDASDNSDVCCIPIVASAAGVIVCLG